MARRRRKGKPGKWVGRLLTVFLAMPALYLIGALVGSTIPVNPRWTEPGDGTTIYIADNGIHADVILPVRAEGLDWSTRVRRADFGGGAQTAAWIAFGSGEQHVYLNTPNWLDLTPTTVWAALAGGPRVIHVEYVASPYYASREIRLRPQEYRRLVAAIYADFARDPSGQARPLRHPGYGPSDAFYQATGNANALRTCNVVVARWLKLAGIEASIWPPFIPGLVWRYRKARA
ncbi:MAG TPA: TIGR02117 family protein [Sphingomicrobium sp.]|nr:TIGR02117 family protein [Sphingomicrobium sp.]